MQKEETLTVEFFLDSTLVVNQLNGLFKVKDVKLRELLFKVRELEQETGGNIQYQVIPREQNSRADNFVNKALDDYPHVSYR
jgi:ribonuclease HI